MNDRCPFCGNIQTLLHVLSNCSIALDQGRYTWRHDSVLGSIIDIIHPFLDPGFRMFSDMPGYQAPHGGTVPPHVLVTNLRPDIFLVNEAAKKVVIFELTCPWDSNVSRSHAFKEGKYAPLVADLSRRFSVCQFSVEVIVRGQVSRDNKSRLKAFVFKSCINPGKLARRVVKCGSYSIFSARKEPTWTAPPPLIIH